MLRKTSIRLVARLAFGAAGTTMVLAACSSAPERAGDECEPGGDPCPAGTVCAPRGGDHLCLISHGQACELGAEEDFCLDGSRCVDDGSGAGRCLLGQGAACSREDDLCETGLECAEQTDGSYHCHPPVLLSGMVFDALSEGAIEGAHVIAFDDSATAISDVALSDAAGNYQLAVPILRDASGAPAEGRIFTLRASAQDYQTFPGGVRAALPIDSSLAVAGEAGWVIEAPVTDVALIPLPDEEQGLASISGSVEGGGLAAGVLVVAERDGAGVSAVADKAGSFTIFNVPDGSYEVRGYTAGLQLTPESVSVAGAPVAGVVLAQSGDGLGSIGGSVNIVNAPGGSSTSVVLVVASTFDDTFVRGEVPRGLRAPLSGPPTVSGSFTIEDVPAGNYVVLASLENDDLVRDPDPNIAGTQIVTVDMDAPGDTVSLSTSFKVTEALAVVSPGADGPEAVSGTPTFVWADDSSEDKYVIVVYDAYGNLVWEDDSIPNVTGSSTVSVEYGGPPLEEGMYYQFRASSWKGSGAISTTEDLRGVFYIE